MKKNEEMYNYENLFKNNKKIPIREDITENNVALIEYKESIFKRIINKVKIYLVGRNKKCKSKL